VTVNANGGFTYTPALNYNGGDSFTYKANDARRIPTWQRRDHRGRDNDAPVAANGQLQRDRRHAR